MKVHLDKDMQIVRGRKNVLLKILYIYVFKVQ